MNLRKRVRIQTVGGGAIWLALWFFPLEAGVQRPIALLLLFAVLVIFPLGLSFTASRPTAPSIPYQMAQVLHPIGALMVVVAYFLTKGILAGTFAIAWLPLTLFAGAHGFLQLRPRGWRGVLEDPAETCLAFAPLYLPVGALWLFAARMGIEPLGFQEPIVSLTAIHFHFAGFAAPVLCGLAGEMFLKPTHHQKHKPAYGLGVYPLIAGIVLAGPALVAVGITFSPLVEALAGAVLAIGYTGLALITLGRVLPQIRGTLPRIFLGISALSAVVTMLAAAGYALRAFNGFPFLSIPQMVVIHGWGNAFGFVFCGLLAWGLHEK